MSAWKMTMTIKNPELEEQGVIESSFPLSPFVLKALENEDWKSIDQYFLNAGKPSGELFEFLKNYLLFDSIEHIIAIRQPPEDEDGIWHDDGSRILGFSLSLTINNQDVVGGELYFRKKGEKNHRSFTTRPLGTILLFKTGIYGYEHMVSGVSEGKRIVIAGWCS